MEEEETKLMAEEKNRSQHDYIRRNRPGDIQTAAYEAMSSEGLEKVN